MLTEADREQRLADRSGAAQGALMVARASSHATGDRLAEHALTRGPRTWGWTALIVDAVMLGAAVVTAQLLTGGA